MAKPYSIILRIFSIITLAAFTLTQVAQGYAFEPSQSKLRPIQARQTGLARAIGTDINPTASAAGNAGAIGAAEAVREISALVPSGAVSDLGITMINRGGVVQPQVLLAGQPYSFNPARLSEAKFVYNHITERTERITGFKPGGFLGKGACIVTEYGEIFLDEGLVDYTFLEVFDYGRALKFENIDFESEIIKWQLIAREKQKSDEYQPDSEGLEAIYKYIEELMIAAFIQKTGPRNMTFDSRFNVASNGSIIQPDKAAIVSAGAEFIAGQRKFAFSFIYKDRATRNRRRNVYRMPITFANFEHMAATPELRYANGNINKPKQINSLEMEMAKLELLQLLYLERIRRASVNTDVDSKTRIREIRDERFNTLITNLLNSGDPALMQLAGNREVIGLKVSGNNVTMLVNPQGPARPLREVTFTLLYLTERILSEIGESPLDISSDYGRAAFEFLNFAQAEFAAASYAYKQVSDYYKYQAGITAQSVLPLIDKVLLFAETTNRQLIIDAKQRMEDIVGQLKKLDEIAKSSEERKQRERERLLGQFPEEFGAMNKSLPEIRALIKELAFGPVSPDNKLTTDERIHMEAVVEQLENLDADPKYFKEKMAQLQQGLKNELEQVMPFGELNAEDTDYQGLKRDLGITYQRLFEVFAAIDKTMRQIQDAENKSQVDELLDRLIKISDQIKILECENNPDRALLKKLRLEKAEIQDKIEINERSPQTPQEAAERVEMRRQNARFFCALYAGIIIGSTGLGNVFISQAAHINDVYHDIVGWVSAHALQTGDGIDIGDFERGGFQLAPDSEFQTPNVSPKDSKTDENVIFTHNAGKQHIYWEQSVKPEFDGRAWHKGNQEFKEDIFQGAPANLLKVDVEAPLGVEAGQEFSLPRPDNSRVVRGSMSSNTQEPFDVEYNDEGGAVIKIKRPGKIKLTYKCEYVKQFSHQPASADFTDYYTQTPKGVVDLTNPDSWPTDAQDKARELLDSIKDKLPQEKAKAVEVFLKSYLEYDTNPESARHYRACGKSNFIRKIINYRKADCDVANTLAVVMCRQLGIPARPVFGYSSDDNSVKSKDAHGWFEAYIEGKGWARFDATPPDISGSSEWKDASEEAKNLAKQVRSILGDLDNEEKFYNFCMDSDISEEAKAEILDLDALMELWRSVLEKDKTENVSKDVYCSVLGMGRYAPMIKIIIDAAIATGQEDKLRESGLVDDTITTLAGKVFSDRIDPLFNQYLTGSPNEDYSISQDNLMEGNRYDACWKDKARTINETARSLMAFIQADKPTKAPDIRHYFLVDLFHSFIVYATDPLLIKEFFDIYENDRIDIKTHLSAEFVPWLDEIDLIINHLTREDNVVVNKEIRRRAMLDSIVSRLGIEDLGKYIDYSTIIFQISRNILKSGLIAYQQTTDSLAKKFIELAGKIFKGELPAVNVKEFGFSLLEDVLKSNADDAIKKEALKTGEDFAKTDASKQTINGLIGYFVNLKQGEIWHKINKPFIYVYFREFLSRKIIIHYLSAEEVEACQKLFFNPRSVEANFGFIFSNDPKGNVFLLDFMKKAIDFKDQMMALPWQDGELADKALAVKFKKIILNLNHPEVWMASHLTYSEHYGSPCVDLETFKPAFEILLERAKKLSHTQEDVNVPEWLMFDAEDWSIFLSHLVNMSEYMVLAKAAQAKALQDPVMLFARSVDEAKKYHQDGLQNFMQSAEEVFSNWGRSQDINMLNAAIVGLSNIGSFRIFEVFRDNKQRINGISPEAKAALLYGVLCNPNYPEFLKINQDQRDFLKARLQDFIDAKLYLPDGQERQFCIKLLEMFLSGDQLLEKGIEKNSLFNRIGPVIQAIPHDEELSVKERVELLQSIEELFIKAQMQAAEVLPLFGEAPFAQPDADKFNKMIHGATVDLLDALRMSGRALYPSDTIPANKLKELQMRGWPVRFPEPKIMPGKEIQSRIRSHEPASKGRLLKKNAQGVKGNKGRQHDSKASLKRAVESLFYRVDHIRHPVPGEIRGIVEDIETLVRQGIPADAVEDEDLGSKNGLSRQLIEQLRDDGKINKDQAERLLKLDGLPVSSISINGQGYASVSDYKPALSFDNFSLADYAATLSGRDNTDYGASSANAAGFKQEPAIAAAVMALAVSDVYLKFMVNRAAQDFINTKLAEFVDKALLKEGKSKEDAVVIVIDINEEQRENFVAKLESLGFRVIGISTIEELEAVKRENNLAENTPLFIINKNQHQIILPSETIQFNRIEEFLASA